MAVSIDEIAAFGKQITRVFIDPSIDNQRDLESAVRTRLNNAIDEDEVTGKIDIMPTALTPGVSYQVEAWNGVYDGRYGFETYGGAADGEPPTLSLGRLTYRLSGGEAVGVLHFETPGGFGDAVSDVERRTREVGEAI